LWSEARRPRPSGSGNVPQGELRRPWAIIERHGVML
jgi:hypothetical protein